ncbi:MAG: isoprenylcysteine carboxylmethyltransferase family protein [Verrucomicrobia bacterium]|nr:MAG: isoprenylcysteine carboxylmethyltransferase family protein [Verrucomicrobiota bacterium]
MNRAREAETFWQRGGGWVLAQCVLMAAVVGASFLRTGRFDPPAAVRVLGTLAMSWGAAVGIAGAWVLRGSRTIFPKPKPEARLVTTGIYARVRHPLYSSLMGLTWGWGCWVGSWPVLAAAAALTALLGFKARHEERWLVERFPEYADYARRVARFIPGLW